MMHRRRGIFLVEMLTVIFMIGIGGTLMAVGLASLLRSQDRVAAFENQFSKVNDFLNHLQRDVHNSTSAALRASEGEEPRQVLLLGELPTQISYRFFQHHVERSGGPAGDDAAKLWRPMSAEVSVVHSDHTSNNTGVGVTVLWRRTDKKDPEPNRRFDAFVRCAGELSNVEE